MSDIAEAALALRGACPLSALCETLLTVDYDSLEARAPAGAPGAPWGGGTAVSSLEVVVG